MKPTDKISSKFMLFWGFVIHTKQKSSLLSQQATEINISKVETDIQIIK